MGPIVEELRRLLLRGNRYLGGRINRLEQDSAAQMSAKRRKEAALIAAEAEDLTEFDRRLEGATSLSAKDKDGRPVTVRWEPELERRRLY
jgi:hypothetical protein